MKNNFKPRLKWTIFIAFNFFSHFAQAMSSKPPSLNSQGRLLCMRSFLAAKNPVRLSLQRLGLPDHFKGTASPVISKDGSLIILASDSSLFVVNSVSGKVIKKISLASPPSKLIELSDNEDALLVLGKNGQLARIPMSVLISKKSVQQLFGQAREFIVAEGISHFVELGKDLYVIAKNSSKTLSLLDASQQQAETSELSNLFENGVSLVFTSKNTLIVSTHGPSQQIYYAAINAGKLKRDLSDITFKLLKIGGRSGFKFQALGSPSGDLFHTLPDTYLPEDEYSYLTFKVTDNLDIKKFDSKMPQKVARALKDQKPSGYKYSDSFKGNRSIGVKAGNVLAVYGKTEKNTFVINTFVFEPNTSQKSISNFQLSPRGDKVTIFYADETIEVWKLDFENNRRLLHWSGKVDPSSRIYANFSKNGKFVILEQ